MCECGCVMNDDRYTFHGPGKTFYLLTLSAGCVDCDAPSGVSIQHVRPGEFLFNYVKENPEHIDGKLTFEKWGDDSRGVGITTGLRRHEFVKALASHLIGVSSKEMGENGVIDEAGAEVILEEAFEDSIVKPHIPKTNPTEDK